MYNAQPADPVFMLRGAQLRGTRNPAMPLVMPTFIPRHDQSEAPMHTGLQYMQQFDSFTMS